MDAVKRERTEAIDMMIEESPVGEHKSNGEVENTAQVIQGQLRTPRLGLQSRYQTRLRGDHPIMPRVIKHAAFVINVCKVGEDGRTAWERKKGQRFNRQLPEIGECVWFLRALSEGKEKLDTRWEDGVFAGVREESREIYVMCAEGVRKVRSYKRRPEEERWNQEEFSHAIGTTWEPEPGRHHIEIKARFSMKDDEMDEKVELQSKEFKPQGIYI